MRTFNVETFHGAASFVDPHTVRVGPDTLLRGEKILIATGSSPVRPAEFPFEHPRVHDSDEILEIGALPKTLAVVGAGVVGAEYACTFAALGVEVHLIDGRDSLLGFLDREISENIERAMTAGGVHFVWKEKVTRCDAPPAGDVTLTLTSGATLAVTDVLVAAGRKSNTADLNLAAAGLTPGKRGLIKVDAQYRSEVPHIFAAGDVDRPARPRGDRNGTGAHGDVCCLRGRLQGCGRADSADRHLHHSGSEHGRRNRGIVEGEGHRLTSSAARATWTTRAGRSSETRTAC